MLNNRAVIPLSFDLVNDAVADFHNVKLNLEAGRVTFHRDEDGTAKLQIPDVIASGKLPDDAIFELEAHMEYIIKKYGLK